MTLGRLGDFSVLAGLLAGQDGIEVIRWWQGSQVNTQLIDRLQRDPEMMQVVSTVVTGDVDGINARTLIPRLREVPGLSLP